MKVNTMHDELIPMTDRIPQKMLTITRFDSMKSAPISPPISMKRKFNGVDRSYYSPQLTSSDVSSNEEHLEEDYDETMPRAAPFILKNGSLKGAVGKLNAAEISLPSPPSSTASSLDNDHATSDSFMSNGDFCTFDSDIVLEGCKMSSEEEIAFQTDVRAVLNDMVEKAVEESIQDEIWAAVKISFDGETILPNGHRLNRGVAVMEYQRDIESRFTNQLNFMKAVLQKNILRYKAASPFLNPVDSIKLKIPHYYQIVREPMDLTTIKHRLNFLWYRNAHECISDIRLILENCFKFNAPQDFVYKSGKRFEEFLNDKLKDMPEEESELPCPPKPNPEEYFKEKDTRPFKRVDPILQENNASRNSLASTSFTTPKTETTPVGQTTSKYTTRSVRGLKLKKPTKDLTTYTEAAAAVTPEMPKQKFGKKVPLNDALKWCLDFVKELFTKKHVEYAWPFYKPVDLKQFPDYLRAIKTPIDLTTIKNLIETGGYENVTRFATAMRLMFSNCIRYNPPESPIIEQARKLRDHFELCFANIPEEYLKMKLEITSKGTPSSSRNVSPSSSRSKSSKIDAPYVSPQITPVEKPSKKRKDKDRDERRDSKKAKRSSTAYDKNESLPIISEGQSVKLEELQLQINTLTLALKTALQGGGATQEAKKLLSLVSHGSVPTTPVTSVPPKNSKKEKNTKGAKRGPKPKQSRQRHLSSSESESDDEIAAPFHPTKMEDLQKLKDDLENLPASDVHSLFSILRETEPSLKVDDTNIEIDFQTLSSHTLIKLRKYVDSVKLNIVKARSSGCVPSHVKRFCNTPTNVRQQPNIINDCDNNLSRAGSRASNLQLSEESSSDSEVDD